MLNFTQLYLTGLVKRVFPDSFTLLFVKIILLQKVAVFVVNIDQTRLSMGMSASADGGPRSRVCARETLYSAPHRHLRKFFGAHVCRVTFKNFEKNLF